jgi:hypothetical protein
MKTYIIALLTVFTVLFSSFISQSNIDGVIFALRSGNSSELSKYFDENVDITLPDKSDNYSRAQAQLIIKDFFGNNGVRGFELRHKGDSPGGHYCSGTLQTATGNFRTNVFMKSKNGKEVLKEIRFQAIE